VSERTLSEYREAMTAEDGDASFYERPARVFDADERVLLERAIAEADCSCGDVRFARVHSSAACGSDWGTR
jgi:hypothetical protein